MIMQSKVNNAANKVSSTNENISDTMNSLPSKVFRSRSWWQDVAIVD